MSIKQILLRTFVLGAIAASTTFVAKAETLDFTLTGPSTDITFALTVDPTTISSYNSYSFTIDNIFLDVSGTEVKSDLTFFTTADSGGFEADTTHGNELFDLAGAQLFSGSTKNPIFNPGMFTLTPYGDTNSFTYCGGGSKTKYDLSIVDPSSVATPEPSSVLLLATGLLTLVGAGISKRFAA